jgi:hypothetical protein
MTMAQPEVTVKRTINARPLLSGDTLKKLADVMTLLGGKMDERAVIDEALKRFHDDLKRSKGK